MKLNTPLLITMISGAVGGLLFSILSFPLPWILGSITGVIIVSKLSIPMAKLPRSYLNVARITIGLAIGAQFSPAILNDLSSYATSIAFLPFHIGVTIFCGWFYFYYFMKLDKRTAFLCSTPGGIAELVLVGEDIKANVPQMALIQGIRILVVIYTLPFLAGNLKGMKVGAVKQFMPALSQSDPFALGLLALIGIAGWYSFDRLRLSGAPIIGPMIFSALLSVNDLLPQEPPDEFFKCAQLLLGTSIGCVFFGYSLKNMIMTIFKSTGFLFLLGGLSALTAWIVSSVTDFSFLSALLAYAPGGQAETSIIAIALGENTGYVALHHLLRLFVIVSLIPMMARYIWREKNIINTKEVEA